ncbi:MAG: DUF86 domain-containing protein [Hyphomonadaceae bacterium]|nr:DUF86 domain-containing protein [Hyphomonadaceae bacterium]
MSSENGARTADAIVAARDNIALIREWAADLSLETLKSDRKTRYAIERAFIAMDAAMRDAAPDSLLAHGVPTAMIAGFRNILAHTYDDVLDDRVILTIRDDLPALDMALEKMLAALRPA